MKYGLIGERLAHSYSKKIHGLLGNFEYELKEISPQDLRSLLLNADFCGLNVTIPYKQAVMPYCTLDPLSQRIGSVNTIINKNGVLYGYNTDYFGFIYMAKRANISFVGKKVLILGSGGTSKTAVCAVQDHSAREIVVVSRNGRNNYQNILRHADSDIIVNTTPVGMYPLNDQCPVSLDSFPSLSGVIDVIYNPLRTRLVLSAAERGIRHTDGLPMLAAQAYYADRLFFEKPHDDSGIEQIAQAIEKAMCNIVLIGMPGCGKTTVGRQLAELLGMNFIDTDEQIESAESMSPAEIITSRGEQTFRKLESEIILKISKGFGQVIATGGGSIMRHENRTALKQNGFTLFLQRELDRLDDADRPLSASPAARKALYEQRLPLYESMADRSITVSDDVNQTLSDILDVLRKFPSPLSERG